MKPSIARGIDDYLARDWGLARESKDAYWAARVRRLGPREGFRIAEELRRQVLASGIEWPSQADRDSDLAAHARLSELLRRVDRARRR